jgi:hypothetical protein
MHPSRILCGLALVLGACASVPQALPIYVLFAPLLQVQFNMEMETLERVLATDGPGPAIIDAVRERWLASAVRPQASAQMSIVGFGLATRSGKTLEAMPPGELLCLVAAARLDWQHEGGQARSELLAIGVYERSPDAPPPPCA